jgi:N-acetyltransferase 10
MSTPIFSAIYDAKVANLYHISRQCRGGKKRETVLWCYKKELGFSTHRKKRIKQIKKAKERGTSTDGDSEDPFERFISSTDIRWTYYKHSHKILGNTFSMLVLQVNYTSAFRSEE